MNENTDALANFHADLQGTTYFWQPERVLTHYALYGQGTYQLNDDLFLTFGGRFNTDERYDEGGRNLDCSMWVGCHPWIDAWGDRFNVWNSGSNVNSYSYDFWNDYGRQVDGVDCVAPAIGCATVQTENDVEELEQLFMENWFRLGNERSSIHVWISCFGLQSRKLR